MSATMSERSLSAFRFNRIPPYYVDTSIYGRAVTRDVSIKAMDQYQLLQSRTTHINTRIK